MAKKFSAREVIAVVAIGSALIASALLLGNFPPKPSAALHREIGRVLARQALAAGGPVEQIVVITRDTESFPQPALNLLMSAFQKEIRRALGKPAAVRELQVDPLRPIEVPPGDFFELIRRAMPGQVLVSLLGPPLLSEAQWAQLQPIKPKIIAFWPGNRTAKPDLGRLLDAGFLHAALISRTQPTDDLNALASRPKAFKELYAVVTPSDRSQLPSTGKGL